MLKRLQFTLERLLLRGVHYRLLMAALIVAVLSVVAGIIVVLLDPAFEQISDAVWWAFLRLTDPGYLGDDEGAVSRSISTVVTVLGYVVFLGLLIAIMTQWMNAWIQRVESGLTPLEIRDHVLILGWNHRTPSIVQELLRTRERVTRFLEGHDTGTLRIVILADASESDRPLVDEMRTALGNYWDDRRVVIRSGNPLHVESLERACFRTAAAIILPGADFSIARPGVADAEVIKSLASVSHHIGQAEEPLAVAALYNGNRDELAHTAYRGMLEVVEADRIIARLIARSALEPLLWKLYSELLTISDGQGLYVRTVPEGMRARFADLQRGAGGGAMLIGVVEALSRSVTLNPPPEAVCESGDELVFVAPSYAACTIAAVESPPTDVPSLEMTPVNRASRRILVLGWSRKVPLVVEEFLSYSDIHFEIDLVGITPVQEREGTIDGYDQGAVRHISANFLDPDVLRSLEPGRYDNVILVARERMGGEAVADAATLSAYLALETILDGTERPGVFVEVLEEENYPLFDQSRVDVMLSPMIVSYVLSQVALKPDLGRVFNTLAQAGGSSVELRRISSLVGPVEFSQVAAAARGRGELALGVVSVTPDGHRVSLRPEADLAVVDGSTDLVVVLSADRLEY